MKTPRNLFYYSPYSSGGLADYAHEQASALEAMGVKVCFLTTPAAAKARPHVTYDRQAILMDEPTRLRHPSKLSRRFQTMRCILGNIRILADCVGTDASARVLFSAYFEYFAPIWTPWLRRLARRQIVFGSVVHDPLRSFVVGPLWWHRWSTACGYSFLREAFVHEPLELPTVRPQPQLRTTVIPHGPYTFPPATESRHDVRRRLGIPADAVLLLAFGHIRDAKNLDLVLEAMAECPHLYLLVAGNELGSGQRPAAFYQQLAIRLGIAARCRWQLRHIPEAEVGNFFEASDLIVLTYSAAFRSASGVLNAAVHFRKPSLASGGQSNLRTMVEKYHLGTWVEPDSAPAIVTGLRRWQDKPPAQWERYAEDNSWKKNAERVVDCLWPAAPNGFSE